MTRAAWESPPDSAFSGPALLASKTWTMGANSRGRPHRIATDQQSFRSPAPWREFHCGLNARGSLLGRRVRGARRGFAFQTRTEPPVFEPLPPAEFSWTGFYLGIHAGGGLDHY